MQVGDPERPGKISVIVRKAFKERATLTDGRLSQEGTHRQAFTDRATFKDRATFTPSLAESLTTARIELLEVETHGSRANSQRNIFRRPGNPTQQSLELDFLAW